MAISLLKANIDAEALLASMIETAIDGIVLIDSRGIVLTLNTAAAGMFEYDIEEVIGNNVSMLMGSPHQERHDQYIQRYLKTGEARIIGIGREIDGRTKTGRMFPARLAVSEIRLDGDSIFAGFIHNLSQVKEAEAKILRLNADLERKVVERTEELQLAVNKLLRTNKQLEFEISERHHAEQALKKSQHELEEALAKEKELNELKSRFVSMASHEFRTPLSTILSSTALISRYTETDQQPNRDKHLKRITSAVNNLNGILNDFLSISKIEEGRIEIQTVECRLRPLFDEVRDEIAGLFKKGQEILLEDTSDQVTIMGDKTILKNIMFNLLSNAIKYSGENMTITCRIFVQDDDLYLSVTDRGIGIPKDDQKHLFSRFFRASNAMNIEGTGLGLNIVAGYISMMGGSIEFESTPGEGSTFTVHFKIHNKAYGNNSGN